MPACICWSDDIWSDENVQVQLFATGMFIGDAPATDGRSAMLWTTQFFDELVSVEVGAMAPAGAIARVDVRMKDAPPCALRAV